MIKILLIIFLISLVLAISIVSLGNLIVDLTYDSDKCLEGDSNERSEGNRTDCFENGYDLVTSCAAYEVGRILGMELEEPDYDDEE